MASIPRRIDRLRFEGPLAVALGLAGAFALWEAPLDAVTAAVAGPAGRGLLAGAAFAALTPAAWWPMRRRRRIAAGVAVPDADPAATPPVRMRRADRHPDAPVPQPIRASRDLGTPFMTVVRDTPAPRALAPSAAPADAEIVPPAPAPDAVPDFGAGVERPGDDATPAAIAGADTASAPAAVPAASPAAVAAPAAPGGAVGRDSLTAMAERLSRGVDRRGGVPPRRSPDGPFRTAQPALRDALATLNRIAERR